jgi:transcriptional regulator with XRE-family HTH domain
VSEIGSSLGRAREERGLKLADAAAATRIRMNYLAALEEERFDELPAGYAAAFLRTYAAYLDLDAERLVDEYASRFPPRQAISARPPSRRRRHWGPRRAAILLLAGVVALLALLVAGELGSGSRKGTPEPSAPSPEPARPVIASSNAAPAPRPRKVERRRRIVLRASSGDCWIAVRLHSAEGPLLYENLLRPGEAVSFVRMPLWVRVGAPTNLVLTVDGRRLTPIAGYGPVNVLVGTSGVRTA